MPEQQDAVATVADETARNEKPEAAPEAAATRDAPPKKNANLEKARETVKKFAKKHGDKPDEEGQKPAEKPAEKPAVSEAAEEKPGDEKGEPAKPKEKAEVKEEPKAEEPKPMTVASLDRVLQQVCKRAGLTDEDLQQLGDRAMPFIKRQWERENELSAEFGRLGRAQRGDSAGETPAKKPSEETTKAAPAKETQAAAETTGDVLAGLGINIDPEIHGEEVADAFKKLGGRLAARDQQIQDLAEYVDRQKATALLEAADRYIANLGETYSATYGKGKTLSLDQNGAELKARKALLEEADIIMAGATLRGRAMDMDEALDRALSIKHRDRFKAEAREEITAKLSERSGQALQKPTNRDAGRTATGVQKAKKTERDFKHKHGL